MWAYATYGGRGITVCKRWQHFENFIADMGERPSTKHILGRKNPKRGFSPSNCRWIIRAEEAAERKGKK